jgi:tetratricopeptide (TPR) repeat protein
MVFAAREGNAVGSVAEAGKKKEPVPTEELIRRLGDDSWSVREQATRTLWDRGEVVLEPLKEAMLSDDPEVVARARELADKIDLGLLPDTSEKVAELVRTYLGAKDQMKSTILRRLLDEKAWRQVLKLYGRETNAGVRKITRAYVRAAVLRGAREAMAEGEFDEALRVIEMAPHDARGLAAWAAFHAARGTARAELQRLRGAKGAVSAQRRMALLRAFGEVDGAAREAKEAGESEVAAAMNLVLGDPVPWMKLARNSAGQGAFFRESYIRWAVERWETGKSDPEIVDSLVNACREAREDDLWAGTAVLFSMGMDGTAEKWFEKLSPGGAALFYASQERIDDFLRILGLDPGNPDYKAWTKKRLDKILADPDHTDDERGEVFLLCSLLEARGCGEQVASWLEGFLDALAKKNSEVFLDILGKLFDYGITTPAVQASLRYIGKDGDRWAQVTSEIVRATPSFAPGGAGEEAPAWIEKHIGDLPVKQRMRVFMALTGLVRDEVALRAEWIKRLRKAAEAEKGKERERLLGLLLEIIKVGGEFRPALDVVRELVKNNPEHPDYGYYLLLLSADGKWKEAAEGWRTRAEAAPYSPLAHTYLAVCLRRLGRENEARREEKTVELMALADGATCIDVGQAYAAGGDFKRAARWWRRALVEGTPGASAWTDALQMVFTESMENRNWAPAAALGEAIVAEKLAGNAIYNSPPYKLRDRFNADLARAMKWLPRNRKAALELIDECDKLLPTDGSIADYFLPALREAGLVAEHDRYFERAWKHLRSVIHRFPKSDNTLNTAAWIAARATRRLDEAARYSERALSIAPNQAAYLDTRAEVWFADGNRQKAIEWSLRAVHADPNEVSLRRQLARFRSAPEPAR